MVGVIIPTRNGGKIFRACLEALRSQAVVASRIVVMDSRSSDGTADVARDAGCIVIDVPPGEFNHGGTRSAGLSHVDDEIVIFLTQDAILADEWALQKIITAFEDPRVGVAYGRQLPHEDANPVALHARLWNYPIQGYVTEMKSSEPRGFRKAFNSNSFAAYRKSALEKVGGFPDGVILGEDAVAAARILLDGWKLAYVSDAQARHSHNYSIMEEARRTFDIGVFHMKENWILEKFGRAEGEGVSFALDQLRWLSRNASPYWMLRSLATNAARYLAYRLGRHYQRLPKRIVRWMAMNKVYFRDL